MSNSTHHNKNNLVSKKRPRPMPATSEATVAVMPKPPAAPVTTTRTTYRVDGKKFVEKNSLTEAALIEAKLRVKNSNKNKPITTEDEKRDERRAANRLSAFQSRQRRKIVIEDLQKTVACLSKDNAVQRAELVRRCAREAEGSRD